MMRTLNRVQYMSIVGFALALVLGGAFGSAALTSAAAAAPQVGLSSTGWE